MDFPKFQELVTNRFGFAQMENPTATGEYFSDSCGDMYTFYLKIDADERIQDVSYFTTGCGFGVATCAILTTLVKGKTVDEARAILAHTPRAIARDWTKLLESAVANAEHNHELIGDELRIHAVKADEGPTLKRFRPRAMGRATKIRKRTSHLSITLTPKDEDR